MTVGTSNGGKDDIIILMVGEDGVGKTSLILSLIGEEFPDAVPAKAEEIIIPAEVTPGPDAVPTRIIDFSTQLQDEEGLHEELKRASVICVVYAVDNQPSIEKITSYWLPKIHKVLGPEHGKPIILVGNKCDSPELTTMDQILNIMNQYAEIETCVECSAKNLKNISELFYYAQKAVLHPTGPLYLAEEKELTPACKKALVRIFKICDADNDGLLNNYELNNFQLRCFNVPLAMQALEDVKAVVKRGIAQEGILNDSLTLKGFLFLHTLFIQRGRHETTWTVLRKFGYDNTLRFKKEYLHPPLKVPKGCTTELSYDGFQFLTALFEKYDEDKDNCLSPAELQNLFSVCPAQPWGPEVPWTVVTNSQGWLTYQGFLAYWVLTTLLDVTRTLEYLAYLGYVTTHRNQLSAITVTRDKRVDWQQKETQRNVFQCHLIGPKDVGKTALMQAFLGRNLRQQAALGKHQLSKYAINTVPVHGQEKYLLLHEIDVLTQEDTLSAFELSCDVVCLMYDISNPHSFEYVARIYKKHFHRTRLPCLLVGTKADRREILQQYELQPAEFCQKYRLPPPVRFNAMEDVPDMEVFARLATLACYPHMKHVYYLHDSSLLVKMSLGAAAAAIIGFVVYKKIPGKKKRVGLDPEVIKKRTERKKRRLEKEIRALQKHERKLKPIDEMQLDIRIMNKLNERKREKAVLSFEEDDRRALLYKEWTRYKFRQHAAESFQIERMIESQEKALNELRLESEELYEAATQIDDTLIPFERIGPVRTPAITKYPSPDGDYVDTTRKWE